MKEEPMNRMITSAVLLIVGLSLMGGVNIHATSVAPSVISQELQRVRYSYASQLVVAGSAAATADTGGLLAPSQSLSGQKSPGKAFVMSLLVPGAGQLYYGSKVKAAFFLGIEAATIGLGLKYHSDGNRLTTDFEQFNADHWHVDDYLTYLRQAYNDSTLTSDASLQYQEISHHLPPFGDGQYYEMTGKYDQFAWGWDDAVLDSLHRLGDSNFIPPRITDPQFAPYSARRFIYEDMRHNANDKFSKATALLMGTLVNHVVSAFEAYITTRRHNQGSGSGESGFSSRIRVDARLRSVYSRNDTPYLKLSYKF